MSSLKKIMNTHHEIAQTRGRPKSPLLNGDNKMGDRKMTIQQKVAELNQVFGSNSNSTKILNTKPVNNSGVGWVGGKRKTRKGKGKKGKKQTRKVKKTKKIKKTRRNRKGKK